MDERELKKVLQGRDVLAVIERALENGDLKPCQRIGRDGFTLLHWSCYYGQTEVVEKLLLLKADATAVENHSWTPAHVCAIRGHSACLQVLLSHGGIDLTERDSRGYTYGHLAAAHGNTYVLQALLKAGMDSNLRDERGWTACHHAAFHGRYGCLQLLVKWQADTMAADEEGNFPAHLAAAEGHVESLRLLVYHNRSPLAVIRSRNNKGLLPKQLAIQFQKQDCADFLSSAETEVQAEDMMEIEQYPAHAAVREGNLHLLKVLMQEGHCSLNDRDMLGSTAAHQAASCDQVGCLQWLLDQGADASLKNNAGESPLDVAKKYTQFKCISVLGGRNQFETEEEPLETIEQARERISNLSQLLEVAKTRYQELGGILDEKDEESITKADEEDEGEIARLKTMLELEREKREELEREADELRHKLHQASVTLLRRQLSSELEQPMMHNEPADMEDELDSSAPTGHLGGAYFKLIH